MEREIIKRYTQDDLTVVWKPHLCIHSRMCVNGLPKVFDFERRPWTDLTQAEAQAIADQVLLCPSGALSLEGTYNFTNEKAPEVEPVGAISIAVIPNGPMSVKGTLHITLPDGSVMDKQGDTFLCRCGQSQNKPFCDGSHTKAGWVG